MILKEEKTQHEMNIDLNERTDQAVHRDDNVSDEMKHRNANSVTYRPQISADHRNVHKSDIYIAIRELITEAQSN